MEKQFLGRGLGYGEVPSPRLLNYFTHHFTIEEIEALYTTLM